MREIEAAEERVKRAIERGGLTETAERAMLISTDSEDSLDELAALAETAGALVVSRVLQKRQRPDPGTFIGSGKAEELALNCQALEVDLAILDDELTGAQQRNLENALGVRVIDRTALILDIFAGRAQSAEGKLQVELAQMKYRLPRLVGLGQSLSRLGGGIGTRGPGETRLEVDRRRVRRRIDDLENQLADLKRQRDMRRARREKQDKTVVALVGYTNAGKSTLLNALSGADVLVEDKLFATLDPVMRMVALPENRECLLVDTVGFIRKLPHQLVEAFHSTLEEALCADLIVVVSDVSSPFYRQQRETVFSVLDQLGAGGPACAGGAQQGRPGADRGHDRTARRGAHLRAHGRGPGNAACRNLPPRRRPAPSGGTVGALRKGRGAFAHSRQGPGAFRGIRGGRHEGLLPARSRAGAPGAQIAREVTAPGPPAGVLARGNQICRACV